MQNHQITESQEVSLCHLSDQLWSLLCLRVSQARVAHCPLPDQAERWKLSSWSEISLFATQPNPFSKRWHKPAVWVAGRNCVSFSPEDRYPQQVGRGRRYTTKSSFLFAAACSPRPSEGRANVLGHRLGGQTPNAAPSSCVGTAEIALPPSRPRAEPGFNQVPGASGENVKAFMSWRPGEGRRLPSPPLLGLGGGRGL